MNIKRAIRIYFSPTQTTKKTIEAVSEGLDLEIAETLDVTPPGKKTDAPDRILNELVLIGTPVYSGRVPPQAAERIRRFKGRQTPAVVVVVYGNRAFDDALLELRDIAVESGFRPIAGAAFIGEHSYADAATPIAIGRPDRSDLENARQFGERIRRKLDGLTSADAVGALHVPGNYPYRERRKRQPVAPLTREDLCTQCGLCAEVCPVAAITVADTVETDPTVCINCFACIKNCPSGARRMENPGVREAAKRLVETCSKRKEPEWFGV